MSDRHRVKPKTIFDKICAKRTILHNNQGNILLYVDRHLLNETSFICFQELERKGRHILRPKQTFIAVDHTIRTLGRTLHDEESRDAVAYLDRFTRENGILFIGPANPLQGIGHLVGGELGLVLPGFVIAGDDSHTTTNGALGALSLGIGFSDVEHVLVTQTLWQAPFRTMRVDFDGKLQPGVDAKDLALQLIRTIKAGGAIGCFLEFAGSCIAALSMDQRMTICNMAVEAGARAAIIAPDETTFAFLQGRAYAPRGERWDAAVRAWKELPSDEGAVFDLTIRVDAAAIAPSVTWGTNPQDTVAVNEPVPDPASLADADDRRRAQAALDYMGIAPGSRLTDLPVDRVFIGSCTNGRLADIRAAAQIAKLGRVKVPSIVVPGSSAVKRQAETEGLDRILLAAGFEWRNSGCSMCLGMNGDLVEPGARCASTTNRNFVGRQGVGARTHLMSPAMAAAAAITGGICDVRPLLKEGGLL